MTGPRPATWPSTTDGLSPAAIESCARLLLALRELDRTGRTTPCQHPDRSHWWTSETRAERQAAASHCTAGACAVFDLCRDHGRHERAGVWAGHDHGVGREPKTTTTTHHKEGNHR